MTFPLKIVGLLKTKVTQDYIQLTTDQTSLQIVGINLTFATGTLTVDWGDGSSTENFVSGIELTHSYGGTGIYNIKISGDLTNITAFIADQCKITTITGLKTGLLAYLRLFNNLYTGNLSLIDAPVKGLFEIYGTGNANLTGIDFAISGNELITGFYSYQTGLTGVIDMSNVPISGAFWSHLCPNLETFLFATSGNGIVTDMRIYGGGLQYLDLSNVVVRALQVRQNTNMTNLTLSASNGLLTSLQAYGSDLGYIDFKGVSLATNNCNYQLYDNNMTAAEVNHILVDLYSLVSGEGAGGDYTGRQIRIDGSNAAPDGSSGGYDGLTAKTNLEGKGFTVTVS